MLTAIAGRLLAILYLGTHLGQMSPFRPLVLAPTLCVRLTDDSDLNTAFKASAANPYTSWYLRVFPDGSVTDRWWAWTAADYQIPFSRRLHPDYKRVDIHLHLDKQDETSFFAVLLPVVHFIAAADPRIDCTIWIHVNRLDKFGAGWPVDSIRNHRDRARRY
jgi:hypothetical protein